MGRRDGGGVVRTGAGRSCELCGAPAAVHCAADAAFLCAACDAKVHGANFLASRHRRTRLVLPAAAAGCQAALASASEEQDEEEGYASAASSCVSTADSAASTAAAAASRLRSRGGRARAASQQATRAARRRAEAVLEGWAKRMGLAPVAARRRAAAAWRALRATGPDARVPPRVAMAAALWWEVVTAATGGACHGDALRRLEACAHVPARLVVPVATSLARARARRRASGADAAALQEGWDECAWAGPKSSPARS